jgi:hypothetical protein
MSSTNIQRKIVCLMVVTVIILALFAVSPGGEKVLADGTATMSISPEEITVAVGDTFTVNIVIDSGDCESTAAECKLSWLPAGIVDCTGVELGDKYEDWNQMYMGPTGDTAFDNQAGAFTNVIGVGTMYAPDSWQDPDGPTGSGTMLQVSFTALKDGIVNLTLSDVSIVNNLDADPSEQFTETAIINGKVYSGNIELAKPDLVITKFLADWVTKDESYNITLNVKNTGGAKSEACLAEIYIDDEKVKQLNCPALEPDESYTDNSSVINISGDNDTVALSIDSGKTVEEIDEENNMAEFTWVKGARNLPDLIVAKLTTDWITPNESYNIGFNIVNNGKVAAAATQIQISVDGQISETLDCPTLDVGGSKSFTSEPVNISGENDQITVTVDTGGVIEESDESNNLFSITMAKEADEPPLVEDPDLTVKNIAFDWIDKNVTYEVSYEIVNQSTVPSAACKVAVLVDGIEQAVQDCPELAPGGEHTAQAGPFDISSDNDDLKITVDIDSKITETDETNNSAIKTITKEVKGLPDLVIRNLDQNWITFGETYEVSFDLVNEGAASSENCLVKVYVDGTAMASIQCPGLDIQEHYGRQVGPFELSGDNDVIRLVIDQGEYPEISVKNNNIECTLRDMRVFNQAPSRAQGITIAWEYVGVIIFAIVFGGTILIILLRR